MQNGGSQQIGVQRYKNLSTFLNVLFALAFFRAVQYLPPFEDKHWLALPYGLLSLLASEPANLTRVIFGLIIVSYCWWRVNTMLSVVERSNGSFESLSIASVAFVFLFLYALIADPMYVGGPPTLLLQSLSLFIAGLLGYFALRYAIHADLVAPDLQSSAQQMAWLDLSNPLTAFVASALSWSGLIVWTISWFVLMPLFSTVLGKVHRAPATHGN
jgi:hypothetical protein